ncbi:hypothetical protein NPS01_23600 [Nocardioides psychrotolerans]|uniref:PASTA domain-containing protein n=1 Tax=Nocardioides psychrotolerans TaxID=1005945 RepID=A0A1I3HXC8_9ACTN|nr:hypothetical protein [Nocardioides psychrotolerans]GEP38697.1 hypothetical protein NPS01_23600 [Nocardioides psychrotolerans]SFI40240.1 hypothetical protein SAMN05216561_10822 [Nocardioides psychrotolerans]
MTSQVPGRRRRSRQALTSLTLVGALALAGCGGDDETPSGRSTSDPSAVPGSEVTIDPVTGEGGTLVTEQRFFSERSPWNNRIDDNELDPASAEMIRLAKIRVGVCEEADAGNALRLCDREISEGVYINTEAWTTAVVAGGEPTDVVCRQVKCGDGDDTVVLDIPADVDPDPRYDGWYTIFDTNSSVAYDLWRARREADGSISYHFMREWDLNGAGFGAPQVVSARGSGLPLFAGLISPDELEAGLIDHALAISLPGPAANWFVQPASSTDGNGNERSIPEGARIRLKADVVPPRPVDPLTQKPIKMTAQQRRYADAIVAALRTYGAIVVDRAAVPTLYAQRDVTSTYLNGNELQGLHLDDFEVVRLGKRYEYPPEDSVDENGLVTSPTRSTSSQGAQ